MTDMIVQNLISQRQTESKKGSSKNRIPTPEDYQRFQIGALPYKPKGYLVSTPTWRMPIALVEDTFKHVKDVGKGLKGKSNDHELGLVNDIGMKAGGLALAGYLATIRLLPAKKGMEFVGFASFFASMFLFPKLFINAPVKALYGFNVDQKCIDSQGRKNNVHRDPQYTPFDLYTPEQIEFIGDKMGVDKNMENRQEFVKRKITKIATQANTLWMLTAGLATPIMGALLSSGIEKRINSLQEAKKTKSVNAKITKFGENLVNADNVANQRFDKKGFEALDTFLSAHKDKPITDKFADELMELVYKGNNLKLKDALKEDLKQIMNSNKIADMSEFLGEIKIELPKQDSEIRQPYIFTQEQIKKCLTGGKNNLNNNQVLTEDNVTSIKNKLGQLFRQTIMKEGTEISDDALTSLDEAFTSALDAKLKQPPALTQEQIDKTKSIFKAVDKFKIKKTVLDEYITHRIGKREDSLIARQWKKTSEGIIKIVGFSNKELAQARKSPSEAGKIFERKITEIVKDDAKYEKVLGKIAELVNSFEEEIQKGISEKSQKSFKEEVTEMSKKFHTDFAEQAKSLSLENVANYIAGNPQVHINSSAEKNLVELTDSNLIGAKSSLYRVVQAFNMFRNLEKTQSANKVDDSIIQLMNHTIMNGTYGDHFVKLKIESPEDYKKVMTNLFPQEIHSSTAQVLRKEKNGTLLSRFQTYLQEARNQLGNYKYEFKPNHIIDIVGAKEDFKALGDSKKEVMVGETLSNLTQKAAEQMYNTKHWQRLFGGIALGVAGITLVAPFFFGKMDLPEKKTKKEVTNNA